MAPEHCHYYGHPHLENDLVSLVPFDPDIHAEGLVQETKAHPELLKYIPSGPFEDVAQFRTDFWDKRIAGSPSWCFFAVYDKKTPATDGSTNGTMAGVIALLGTYPEWASTEIGWVLAFKAFHRTHVNTNAVGLLLKWTLDQPSAGGLGLRRVQWQANAENLPSRNAALRMGFEFEGIIRWQRSLPRDKDGLSVAELEKRNGTHDELPGRSTAMLSIVWDEWDEKRPKVVALMQRKS